MKIIIISNCLTPHQIPLCQAFSSMPEVQFMYIESVNINKEILPVGWRALDEQPYLVSYNKFTANFDYYRKKIVKADAVIFGSAPFDLVKERVQQGKITFLYSERIYKNVEQKFKWLYHLFKFRKMYQKYDSLFLLCASAFSYRDYLSLGCFRDKAFRWGYFPTFNQIDELENFTKENKTNSKAVSLLWASRLIKYKHPELAIEVVRRLVNDGYMLSLSIVGTGYLENEIKSSINKYNLQQYVKMLGAINPSEVRKIMDKSDIFLFTSDKGEGWGAVLNESMNSACAVVASHAIGAVPYLIDDNNNGIVYKDKDVNDLYAKVKYLIDNPEIRTTIGMNAYKTIANIWNPQYAASRFLELVDYLEDRNSTSLHADGPCSRAKLLTNNWH